MSDYVFIESVGGDCGGLVLLLHMLYVCVCEYAEVGRNLWGGEDPLPKLGLATCNAQIQKYIILRIYAAGPLTQRSGRRPVRVLSMVYFFNLVSLVS